MSLTVLTGNTSVDISTYEYIIFSSSTACENKEMEVHHGNLRVVPDDKKATVWNIFTVGDLVFNALFFFECAVKLFAYRPREYVKSWLNNLDLLTVVLFLFEMALASVLPSSGQLIIVSPGPPISSKVHPWTKIFEKDARNV